MSTASATTSPTPPRDSAADRSSDRGKSGIDRADSLIQQRIAEARRALWMAEMIRATLWWAIVMMMAILLWVIVDQWVYAGGWFTRSLAASGFLFLSAAYLWRRVFPLLGSSVRPEYAARSIERDLPELRQELTSYITLNSNSGSQLEAVGSTSRNPLADRVLRSMGANAAGRLKSHDVLPSEATGTLRIWLVAAGVLAVLILYGSLTPKSPMASLGRLIAPMASIEPPRRVAIRDVQPGDADVRAGSNIDVSARIDGLRPDEPVICRWKSDERVRESELVFDPSSRRYLGEIGLSHEANGQVAYELVAGDAVAGPYHLMVDDVPVVAIDAVHYAPPKYTAIEPYTRSSGAITAIDGTRVTVVAKTNRSVAKATIEFNPRRIGESMQATAGATEMTIDEQGRSQRIEFSLRNEAGKSAAVQRDSYRIRVWDEAGQASPDPIVYPIRVIADFPPEVAIVMPQKTPKNVPINAQQLIEVHASDPDFALQRVMLRVRRGIDLVAEPILWSDPQGASGIQVVDYRFRPAEHGLRVGDVVMIRAVAVDNRFAEDDPLLEPNQSQTDAIELRITAAEELEHDPQADDGLTQKDDAPASNAEPESAPESRQPPDQANADSQEGDAQEGDAQAAGDEVTGQQGAGQQGETGEQGSEGQQGAGQQGESGEQSGAGQQGESGEQGSAGEPSGEGDQSSDAPSPSDPSTQGGTAEESASGDSGASGESTGEADAERGEAGGESGEGSGTSQSQDGTTSTDAGERRGDESAGGGEPADSATPPKHDGEAFERIREHIEQQRARQDSATRDNGTAEKSSDRKNGDSDATNGSPTPTSEDPQADSERQADSEQQADSERSGAEASDAPPQGNESLQPEVGEGSPDAADAPTQEGADPSAGQPQESSSETDPASTQRDGADADAEPSPSGQPERGSSDPPGPGDASSPSAERPSGNDQPGSEGESTGESTGESQSESRQASEGGSPSPGDSRDAGDRGPDFQPTGDDAGLPGALGGDEAASTKPSQADLEYAQQATDMVLDYLDQTRDAPDQALMEKLNWTEEDLRRFSDRWRQARELEPAPGAESDAARDWEETLKSLGLRRAEAETQRGQAPADTLRSLRDAGNRKPPPPAHRDAFDAFRRAIGRQP